MNKSILIAGAMIAYALLLHPAISRLAEKQTISICTKTGMFTICSERDAGKPNPLYGVFKGEKESEVWQITDIHAPSDYLKRFQDMTPKEISALNNVPQAD